MGLANWINTSNGTQFEIQTYKCTLCWTSQSLICDLEFN